MNIYKLLWDQLSDKRKRQILVFILLAIIASFAEIISLGSIIPLLGILSNTNYIKSIPELWMLFERFKILKESDIVKAVIIVFITSALISGSIRLFVLWLGNRIAFAVGSDLSQALYEKTLLLPYLNYVKSNSSKSIVSITSHVNTVVSYVLQPFALLIISFVVIIGILFTLISINPIVAIFSSMVFGLSYLLIISITRKKLHENGLIIVNNQDKIVKALQEGLGGFREVIINNLQKVYIDQYKKSESPLRKAQSVNLFIAASPRYIMETMALIFIAFISYYYLSDKNKFIDIIPTLGATAFGAQRLLPVLQQSFSAWAGIRGNKSALVNILKTLNTDDNRQIENTFEKLKFQENIKFNNVSFRYENSGKLIVNNLNFTINKGQKIGIVGPTGSGKSTILDMLMGLFSPNDGYVSVDNIKLEKSNIKSWQMNIAQVPQSVYLIDGTIAENIAFGEEINRIDFNKLECVCKDAQIDKFIEDRENKYLSIVGERGVSLSGGQRQRIAIARALYRSKSLLIFDEATSALDSETEKAVMDAISSLDNNVTVIIVAHRLSTVEFCDQILEIRNGQMVSMGTYNELLIKSDSFRKLVNSNKSNIN